MFLKRPSPFLRSLLSITLLLGSVPFAGATGFLDLIGVPKPKTTCVQALLQQGQLAYQPREALDPRQMNYELSKPVSNPIGTIVLIHGLGGMLETWTEVSKELTDRGYQVLSYDQRGHGLTVAEGENYSSSLLATDLKGLLDHLKIKKVHLIGHSMGARTALRFANLYPDRAISVISEDMHFKGRSKLLPDHLDLAKEMNYLDGLFKTREEAANLVKQAAAFYRDDFLGKIQWEDATRSFVLMDVPFTTSFMRKGKFVQIVPAYGSQAEVNDIAEGIYTDIFMSLTRSIIKNPSGKYIFTSRPHVSALYSTQGLQEDFTEALKTLNKPLLLLGADKHPVLFGVGVDHSLENCPFATFEQIPESSHGIHHSQPELFMDAITAFFAAHGGQ